MKGYYKFDNDSFYFLDVYGEIQWWYLGDDYKGYTFEDFEKSCKEGIDQTGIVPANVDKTIKMAWCYLN